jgi:hypothetical protein
MADFKPCVEKQLFDEKYWTDDPQDDGGLTIWGIDTKDHPADVAKMELMSEADARDYATQIYRKSYWDVINLDNEPDQKKAMVLFSCCVNQGLGTVNAIKKLLGVNFTSEDFIRKRCELYIGRCISEPTENCDIQDICTEENFFRKYLDVILKGKDMPSAKVLESLGVYFDQHWAILASRTVCPAGSKCQKHHLLGWLRGQIELWRGL